MGRKAFKFGFRSNVFILCVGLTALITVSIAFISFNSARSTIEKSAESLIDGNVEQVSKRFDMFVDGINRITLTVSFTFAADLFKSTGATTYQQQKDFKDIVGQFSSLSSLSKSIFKLELFNFKSNEIMAVTSIRKVNPDTDQEFKTMAGLFAGNTSRLDFIILENRSVTMENATRSVVTFVFPITNANNSISGCVAAYVPFDDFNDFCSDIARNTNGSAVLVNGSGRAIAASDAGLLGKSYDNIDMSGPAGNGTVALDGREMLYSYRKTSWKNTAFLCIVPYQAVMLESTRALRENIVISAVFIMLMALIIIFVINTLLFTPIRRMLRQLQKNASIPPKSGLKDEIGFMLDNLTENMAQNQKLMQVAYEQELRLKDARIRLLMSQMNPHFLYNSLDTILWLLEFRQYRKIKPIIHSLARFYRASTDKGGEFVTVRQEKSQIENFLFIQSFRFSDRLSVTIDFHEDILDCLMIKFLLQPLVENAIRHGIEKKDGLGKIAIAAERTGGDMVFCVEDDGVGMTLEKLEELRGIIESPNPDEKAFYALQNINLRIKLQYGEPYGLSVESEPGRGTRVTIRIPAMTEQAKERPDA